MFDGQVVRPPPAFRALAERYVCVRILNIDDVDLDLYSFDYDLTLAFVLANADGTVYHRYGGRDHLFPMNMDTLLEIMEQGLTTHRRYEADPQPPVLPPPQRLSELVHGRLQDQIKPIFGCYHCHYVREARQMLSLMEGEWRPDQFWIWPLPKRLGLIMGHRRQYEIQDVLPGSPAAHAGLSAGDRLEFLRGRRILTRYDIQAVLEEAPSRALSMPFMARRGSERWEGELILEPTWKVGDPRDYLWRVRNVYTEHMIKFLPAPGLIGEPLPREETGERGGAGGVFALRVTQLNEGTRRAGVRRGDVVVGAGGRSEFESVRDFHAWCEQLRRAGRDLRLDLARPGGVMSVMIPLDTLNESRVEKAPRVRLGFIVQELPANEGLRVGHVTDDSSAEKTGLRIGDRIVSVDGTRVRDQAALDALLSAKWPGDLLTMEVRRDDAILQLGFVLPGEEETKSDLARLSDEVREAGQTLTCTVTLKLPPEQHVYSLHHAGFGVPTQLEFRGQGYRLIGAVREPMPRRIEQQGLETMWVLDGTVELKQPIVVTDPAAFHLVLRVYAQVCDDRSCHEFRALIANDGSSREFTEYRGNEFRDGP